MKNIFRKDLLLVIVLVIILIPIIIKQVRGENWGVYNPDFSQLTDNQKMWQGVASTPNGETVVAVSDGSNGDIWVSIDKGLSWTNKTVNTDNHGMNFQAVAVDSTGQKIVAVGNGYGILTSTDAGETWVNPSLEDITLWGQNWWSVASNLDGTKLAVVARGPTDSINTGDIYTSTDSGATWVDRTIGNSSMSGKYWSAITSNDTGDKLVAVEENIWASTDNGVSWVDISTGHSELNNKHWTSVDTDSTGNFIAVVSSDGSIFTSTNRGITWTDRSTTTLQNKNLSDIAINADGTQLVVISDSGLVLRSMDSGVTWTIIANTTKPWKSVTSNAIGNDIFIVANKGVVNWGSETGENPFGGISAFTYIIPVTNESSQPIRSGGLIPLAFLTNQFNQQRVIDQQNCTITINNISRPCNNNQEIISQTESQNKTTTVNKVFNFLNNLKYGMISEEVRDLQIYLNHIGYIISQSGLGSIGKETNYFGNLTKQALIKYQTDYSIFPNLGYFGPKTRDSFLKNNPLFIRDN